jgi:ophiobolin F synthase
MSILRFSMNLRLDEDEIKSTLEATTAAYNSWVLVNDYFSWEKEFDNYQNQSAKGDIASAVYLFAKWDSLSFSEAKLMVREKIIAYEEQYRTTKEALLAQGKLTARSMIWLDCLDCVTAGNFVWSMSTPRYDRKRPNAYPSLLASMSAVGKDKSAYTLASPISSTQGVVTENFSETACSPTPEIASFNHVKTNGVIMDESKNTIAIRSLHNYEDVSQTMTQYK